MIKFTKAVALKKNGLLEKVPNSPYFEVKRQFVWYVDYKNRKWEIKVEKWFYTDLWSIPAIFRPFFDRNHYVSFILHDSIYYNKPVSRFVADGILREALKVEWAWFIERWLIYLWVRFWGGIVRNFWNYDD